MAGDFTSTIVTRFELETSAQNAALAETSGRLEKVARELEKSTDGFDKLRSNVDATTDRLRIFGTRARGLADAIDDHIRDPVERARIALQHFERISNRSPGKLDKLNDAVGRGRVQWEAFKEQLGPAGQLMAGIAAGAAAALAVAIGRELVKSVLLYIKTDKEMQASVKRTEEALERLRMSLGKSITEMAGFKDTLDDSSVALDTLRHLIEDTDTAANTFQLTVKTLISQTGLGGMITTLRTAVGLWRELAAAIAGETSLADPITPGSPRRGQTLATPPPEPGIGRGSAFAEAPAPQRRGGGGRGRSARAQRGDAINAVSGDFWDRLAAAQREQDANVQGRSANSTSGLDATNAQLEVMSSRWEMVAAEAGKATGQATEFQKMLDSTKVDAIAGLATSFGTLAAGLATGTSGFDDFAASALQSLSQIAAQWGALLLAYGFGVSKVPGLNIGSASAIKGGLGLLAVAGAAGAGAAALSGGGGGSAGGGGGTASVPSSIEPRGLFSTQRDSGPNVTQVQVFLDGDEMTGGFAKILNRAARLGQLQLAGAR